MILLQWALSGPAVNATEPTVNTDDSLSVTLANIFLLLGPSEAILNLNTPKKKD